jgi:hypothetical protein
MRKLICAAAAALTIVSPANAACWTTEHADAARVRDLQTFLMVETLRCSAIGYNISRQYNAFVRGNRAAIGQANDKLKAFFIRSSGPVYGQSAYDRFTTRLANTYGASPTDADTCDSARSVAEEAAMMQNDGEGLLMIADRQGLDPALPGGLCGRNSMAARER